MQKSSLVYDSQGQYALALDSYQQALEITRAVQNRAGEGSILNNMGGIYHIQGQYALAIKYYQQSLKITREVRNHAGEGSILNSLGSVCYDQGEYALALEYYQQSLVIRREVGDRMGEGTTLNNLGGVYNALSLYDQALEYHQNALEIAKKEHDRTGEGTALASIGAVYAKQGQYSQALDVYQQALVIAREVQNRVDEGSILNNLGRVYTAQGQYALALDHHQQALHIVRTAGNRPGEGDTLNDLGTVYASQGEYVLALEHYQQSLVILREVADRAGEGTTLNNLGAIYRSEGKNDQAIDYYQQALVIRREVGDQAGEGATLNNLGQVYADEGQYFQSLEYYQRALSILWAVGDRAGEGTTLNNLGTVYRAQGQYDQAIDYFQQALVIAREVGDRAGEGTTLNNLGVLYNDQGQYAQAVDHLQQAIGVFEVIRASAGSEQGRASFIAQHARTYARTALLHHLQSQDEQAFFISERGRARAFLDSLATGYVQLADNEAQDLLIAEQEAYTARQAAQDALAKARAADPPDATQINNLEQQLATTKQAHANALQVIEDRGGQLAALVPGRSNGVLGVTDVQALLDPDTTLVSYFVGEEQTLAFILTHDQFNTIELPVGQNELRTQVEALRAFSNLDDAQPASARQIYNQLIAPLKEYITTPHLVIVPHSVLHYLPFAALSDGERFLIDDYTLTVLPSASSLPFIQANSGRNPSTALVFGNPVSNEPNLKPLAAAEDEARAIANFYETAPLLGAAASEPALSGQAGQSGIVHLAAHARFNPITPLSSAIYLAPAGDTNSADASTDGRLEVGEIYGLDLHQADLVVLSACEAQLGELSAGDELVGMTRAFVFAGTPSVIATLWSVDDQPTALLMERFYTHLRAGKSKAEALRLAQQEIRKDHPSPYYWAGFVLSGDPGHSKSTLIWPWITGGGLLGVAIIGGGLLIWHRARRLHGQPLDAADGQSEASAGASLPEERGG